MSRCRNFQASLLNVTGGAANTEVVVTHGLVTAQGQGMIPRGMLVVRRNRAADLYESGTPWDDTFVYLKSSVAGAQFSIILFV
jgi:hypothetical protein